MLTGPNSEVVWAIRFFTNSECTYSGIKCSKKIENINGFISCVCIGISLFNSHFRQIVWAATEKGKSYFVYDFVCIRPWIGYLGIRIKYDYRINIWHLRQLNNKTFLCNFTFFAAYPNVFVINIGVVCC